MVTAGFESAEEGRPAGPRAGLRQRHGLGVGLTRPLVTAAAHDLVAVHEHSADQGIGVRTAATRLGQCERLFDVSLVVHSRPCTVPRADDAGGVVGCFSRPDSDRRPRSSTWSTSYEGRGL